MPSITIYRQVITSDCGEIEWSPALAGDMGIETLAETERGVAHKDKASAMIKTNFLRFTDLFSFLIIYFYPFGIELKTSNGFYVDIIDVYFVLRKFIHN